MAWTPEDRWSKVTSEWRQSVGRPTLIWADDIASVPGQSW